MNCFTDYLIESDLPSVDLVETEQLPKILENFYSSVCKKPKNSDNYESTDSEDDTADKQNPGLAVMPRCKKKKNYKNTSMRAIRAAIGRYYKEKRSIDIISGEPFIRVNSVFIGILQLNKESGLGNIESKPELSDLDISTLTMYFKATMSGPPDPKKLQDIVIFNILFYMCR